MLFILFAAAALSQTIRLVHRNVTRPNTQRRAEPTRLERGISVVQFRGTIDARLLTTMTRVLDYAPTEYIPDNALLIYINSTATGAAFTAALNDDIQYVERLRTDDRTADVAAAVDAIRQSHRDARTQDVGAPTPGTVVLRARSFFGASVAERTSRFTSTQYETQLAAAIAAAPIASVPEPPRLRRGRSRTLITLENVALEDARAVTEALATHDERIYWIDVVAPFEVSNTWAVPAVHRAADAERAVAPAVAQDGAWAPLLGLRGANQTIGISDTGIANMCFFSDGIEPRDWPTISGFAAMPADTGHPKVRVYSRGIGGDYEDAQPSGGHGTHVAGSLVGRAPAGSPAAKYNGGAPDARLAFVDLLAADANPPYLAVPDLSQMLQWLYDAGARIHSGSWGSANAGRYTSDDADIDATTWRLRELLVVFAAGNGGREGAITTPGMNKNGLTVGATMNGADAYALVTTPPRPFADLTPRWLAPFSSRGSATLAFAKPDLVAPGGYYVSSASSSAPADGSCADEARVRASFAGTSMATPAVSAAAALVREALQRAAVAGTLQRDGGGALPVRASLVRAVLAAGGRPLDGIYPRAAYASATEQRNAEGFGRVALDRVLGPTATLAVLSNERDEHGLATTGAAVRACVGIEGLAAGGTLAGYELVVQLAYADYPSSVVAAPSLVNNIDLQVTPAGDARPLPVNYGTTSETRTTLERVIVSPARPIDVRVVATQLGFGGAQTFSLIAVLRAVVPSSTAITRRLVVTPLAAADARACFGCGALQPPTTGCAQCGDGRVDAPEQCEPARDGAACDAATCLWRAVAPLPTPAPTPAVVACSRGGVLMAGRCVCLPGWAGASCASCAAATVAGSTLHCVGAPRIATAAGAPTHFFRSVASSTVAARLAGTYYTALAARLNRTAPAKLADARPGVGALDCWCRQSVGAPNASAGAAGLAAAFGTLAAQMQWAAVIDVDYYAPTVYQAAAVSSASALRWAWLAPVALAAVL